MLKSDHNVGYSRFNTSSFANLFSRLNGRAHLWTSFLARADILPCSTIQQWHQRSFLSLDAQRWFDRGTIDSLSSNFRWKQGSDMWLKSWRLHPQTQLPPYTVLLLQWNECIWVYRNYTSLNQYNTLIETFPKLLEGLHHNRILRLELINTLSDDGMSNQEISDVLNSMRIKTPTQNDCFAKLIWVTLKKYRKRLEKHSFQKIIQIN